MKSLPYLFAAGLGAVLASWVTYRLFSPLPETTTPRPGELVSWAAPPPPAGTPVAAQAALEEANAALRAQLAETRAKLEQSDITLARARESLEELRRPMTADLLSSTLRAELKSGEVVVTGGYALPDGSRLFAFVQPTVERIGGADVVKIASTVRRVTDAAGQAVGLGGLATNADNTLQHGEVWLAAEQHAVLGALDQEPGTRGETYPGVAVAPGVSSVIELGELRLKVTPALGADRESLDFEVRLEQARPAPTVGDAPPAAPVN